MKTREKKSKSGGKGRGAGKRTANKRFSITSDIQFSFSLAGRKDMADVALSPAIPTPTVPRAHTHIHTRKRKNSFLKIIIKKSDRRSVHSTPSRDRMQCDEE